ncbi:formylglycine-generating enzyme family protein [Croceicoccus sp. F390]|uniref:Formylglycine-generating enzyme family protein n=1 Tax=Croceicoccus esteveae TaxID=3075597 RepID=A0ABU2ZE60_9SPHN|nr:formylglycine-generating enzyme family protein [Croceicoccus sp. F390]MDT0574564.1 formylglycine-generating enzyme family protein [Croceicoccus sp. F390]
MQTATAAMLVGLLASAVAACNGTAKSDAVPASTARTCPQVSDTPVRLEGGSFLMGQEDVYAEEGPVRQTRVDGFWIDPHEVTNRQFAQFVRATGYRTVAQNRVDPSLFNVPVAQIPADMLKPGSAVFTPPDHASTNYADWWRYMPGASWQKPYGPDGPDAAPGEPVVHLAWADMATYAKWKGGRLPTEAEWEYAASAGKLSTREQPDEANSWQGIFPVVNQEKDGFRGVAPVGCYSPNANGLYDMIGNVWEVTADFYRPGHDPADNDNPGGPSENAAYDPFNPGFASRTMKGGSYLCAPNYCQRYRPAARQGRDPGLGASNVGFRLVYDAAPDGV